MMKLLSDFKKLNYSYRVYSTSILENISKTRSEKQRKNNTEVEKLKQQIKEITTNIYKSDISSFIDENNISSLKQFKFYKSVNKAKYSFIADEAVAKNVAQKIVKDVAEKDCLYIEGNPGVGLLTLSLLNAGVPKIILYDDSHLKSVSLNNILNKYSQNLNLVQENLFAPYNKKTITKCISTDEPKIITGVVFQKTYFSTLCAVLMSNKMYAFLDNTKFYLVVSSVIKNGLIDFEAKSRISYRLYCMFNLMFNVEILASYRHNFFLPLPLDYQDKFTYLLKITKKNNFLQRFEEDELHMFLNFITFISKSRYQFVIPTIEKIMPDSGLVLIHKGISMMNQIKDILPEETITLYNILKKCPNFDQLQYILKVHD